MLKKLAILTPGFKPVPAVEGGAIETLISQILEENERNPKFIIDVYTISNSKLNSIKFNYTNIIQMKNEIGDKARAINCKIMNRLCKILKIQYAAGINDKKIANSLRDNKYDYILIENNMNIFKKVHKNYKGDSKFIFHLHNSIENDPGKSYKHSKYISLNADLIFTASSFLQMQFKNYFKEAHITSLINCVDLNIFKPIDTKVISDFKKKNHLNDSDFVLTYSGRLTPEKGVKEILLALEKVIKIKPNCKLIVAGTSWFGSLTEGKYAKELNRIYLKLKENIIFTGYIENNFMPVLYNASDVTIVPSLCQEAFGLTALESLACGTPVLATNIGGLAEVVSDEVGKLVNIDENLVESLKNNILDFMENPMCVENLSKNTRKYVLENFSTTRKYFELFNNSINNLDKI